MLEEVISQPRGSARAASRESLVTIRSRRRRIEAVDLATGASRPLIPADPLASSATREASVLVEWHLLPASELPDCLLPGVLVLLNLTHPITAEYRSSPTRPVVLGPGSAAVYAHIGPGIRTDASTEVLAIELRSELVSAAAAQLGRGARVDIMPQRAVDDPQIRHLGFALKAELEQNGADADVYAESVAHGLALHLVRQYGVAARPTAHFTHGLPRRYLRRAIEYMGERLADDVTVAEIAAAVHLSPYHFARLFKQSTGISPHQYLLRRRIERAKQLLAGRMALAEVSLASGFPNQSHFTTVFRRIVGTTPKRFRDRL